jgi:hypothetical protein
MQLEILPEFPTPTLLFATRGRIMRQVRIRVIIKEARHRQMVQQSKRLIQVVHRSHRVQTKKGTCTIVLLLVSAPRFVDLTAFGCFLPVAEIRNVTGEYTLFLSNNPDFVSPPLLIL